MTTTLTNDPTPAPAIPAVGDSAEPTLADKLAKLRQHIASGAEGSPNTNLSDKDMEAFDNLPLFSRKDMKELCYFLGCRMAGVAYTLKFGIAGAEQAATPQGKREPNGDLALAYMREVTDTVCLTLEDQSQALFERWDAIFEEALRNK